MTLQFSDIIAEDMPQLDVDTSPKDEDCFVLEHSDQMTDQARESLNELLWENEEARQFYENLPNLSVYLPNLVPKVTAEAPPAPLDAEEQVQFNIILFSRFTNRLRVLGIPIFVCSILNNVLIR